MDPASQRWICLATMVHAWYRQTQALSHACLAPGWYLLGTVHTTNTRRTSTPRNTRNRSALAGRPETDWSPSCAPPRWPPVAQDAPSPGSPWSGSPPAVARRRQLNQMQPWRSAPTSKERGALVRDSNKFDVGLPTAKSRGVRQASAICQAHISAPRICGGRFPSP